MIRYYSQTAWLLNPRPDGRSPETRISAQCWPVGTRWTLAQYDDGRWLEQHPRLSSPQIDAVLAVCDEVEPGFGVLVSNVDASLVIGRLLDAGKINIEDVRQAYEIDIIEDHQEFLYRHWLRLDAV